MILLGACGRVGFDVEVARDAAPAVASYAATVLADHPLAYFHFDEPAGSTVAIDASGNGQDGTYELFGGTIDFAVAGAFQDPAVSLVGGGNAGGGTAAYVQMPQTLNPWAGDFSIEAWLLPGTPPPVNADNGLVVWEDYLISGFRTGWTSDDFPELWTSEAGATADVRSATPLVATAWNYLVFTKQGLSVTIYLDGVDVITQTIDYNVPPIDADNGVGSVHGMPSSGSFDEVAIYGVALSQAQVAAHYAASE